MADQKKPEELKDHDLDAAQGGFIAFGEESTGLKRKRKGTLSTCKGADRFIGETEKNIVANGGGSDI